MRSHVRLLAAHVLGAHVDDALEAEQRACRGRRHAVLAGAGLGDHARLAHALGEQRLPERVVDLVRAGVGEVLALQPDLAARRAPRAAPRGRAASGGRRSRAAARRARATNAGSARAAEPLALELVQRRDQRLGHVAAAVGAEAPLERRAAHAASVVGRLDRAEERGQLRWVLAARRGLGAARRVDRERAHGARSPRPRSPASARPTGSAAACPDAGERAPSRSSHPSRPARDRRVGVEQVEVGLVGAQVLDLRGVAHARGLDHLGSPCGARPPGSRRDPRRRGAGAG